MAGTPEKQRLGCPDAVCTQQCNKAIPSSFNDTLKLPPQILVGQDEKAPEKSVFCIVTSGVLGAG